jgi:cyclopropane fatty-acyl-phospholipid synthase-like methyltransferase
MININFINKTKNCDAPILYQMSKVLLYGKKGKCLSLGPGAGNAEIDLIEKGWCVDAVDIEPHSYVVMLEKIKSKKLKFIHSTFAEVKLTKKYNLIIAINSIPFMKKNNIVDLFCKLKAHSNKGCIYVMTFFGKKHSFVKPGKEKSPFSMSINEVSKLFKTYKIKILLIEENYKNRPDGVLFNVINVIGNI